MKQKYSTPLVSVLVTAYNHEAYASQAIQSILSQVGNFRLEVIYCDDASTDKTPDIAKEIQLQDVRFKPILREKNVGILHNFLDGLRNCTGEYIAYCDGDDFWLANDKIQTQLNALQHHESCGFCFHDVMISDSNGILHDKWSASRDSAAWETGVKIPEVFLGTNLIVFHASSVLFRREAIDGEFLQKIDNSLTGLDFAIAIMLGAYGPGYYLKEVLASYRKHQHSISARQKNLNGICSIFRQVETLEKISNQHYDGKFAKVCAINRKGHVIQGLNNLAEMSTGKSKGGAPTVTHAAFLQMLISQVFIREITMRDAIYIARHHWINRVIHQNYR